MKRNILIVEALFYPHIAKALREGAIAVLEAAGARFEYMGVPGALEVPPAILFAAQPQTQSGRYRGFVALGTVIRGETYHFEIVANQSAAALMELSLRHGLCIGNGILTCETEEQAIARASPDQGNKGGDAARACLALMDVRDKLEGGA
jgi:6,7-dimethyl-8-ribityllumazine synthase